MPDFDREIRRIRYIELHLSARYPSDVIRSPMHLSLGQEWPSVAVCAALKPQDKVIGSYRCHALYLAKGGDLRKMIAELYGRPEGCCMGNGGSMHLCASDVGVLCSTAIVGNHIPIACGWAYAGSCVACFLGDAAVETGQAMEAFNLAQLHELPILYLCENNGLAVNTRIEERTRLMPADRVAPFFDEIGYATGPDELYRQVEAWREAPYPHFIECKVRRAAEHCGPVYSLIEPPEDPAYDDVREEVDKVFAEFDRSDDWIPPAIR
jgi:hypothetical protein